MATTSEEFTNLDQVAIRQLSENQVRLFDENGIALYDVVETLSIQLSSTESDNVEPVTVGWTLVDFDGQTAHL